MPDVNPIEAHERTVGSIFGEEYAFEIPVYQRPYAWEVEQVRDLLNDLAEAMHNDGVYFFRQHRLNQVTKPSASESGRWAATSDDVDNSAQRLA